MTRLRFPYGHATHPDGVMAVQLVLAQLKAQMQQAQVAKSPELGLVYLTTAYASQSTALMAQLSEQLPCVKDWLGLVVKAVVSDQVAYVDEPALAVMLCDVQAHQYRLLGALGEQGQANAVGPEGFVARAAWVHADGQTPDLEALLEELAGEVPGQMLFGGVSSARTAQVEFAKNASPLGTASVFASPVHAMQGGLSGVVFDVSVPLLNRITHGCQAKGPWHEITAWKNNLILQLDHEPALQVLQRTLGLDLARPQEWVEQLKSIAVALDGDGSALAKKRVALDHFDESVRVRTLLGLDVVHSGLVSAELLHEGMRLRFCERTSTSVKVDLTRMCTEIRARMEPDEMSEALALAYSSHAHAAPQLEKRVLGAIYVSCAARAQRHFAHESEEMQRIRHALGDVPLVGFWAGAEVAQGMLHGMSGVLTVFTS